MMREEQEQLLSRITYDPEIFGGKPMIRGRRFRVIDVLELCANGMNSEQIPDEHPVLEADDIAACLLFAARALNHTAFLHAV